MCCKYYNLGLKAVLGDIRKPSAPQVGKHRSRGTSGGAIVRDSKGSTAAVRVRVRHFVGVSYDPEPRISHM